MGGVGRLSADTTDSTVAPGRRGLRSGRAGPLGAPETERPSECRSRCEAPTQQTPPGPGEASSRQTIQRGSLRVGSAPTHPGGTPNVRRSSLAQPKHSSARPWPTRPAFEKQRLLRGALGTQARRRPPARPPPAADRSPGGRGGLSSAAARPPSPRVAVTGSVTVVTVTGSVTVVTATPASSSFVTPLSPSPPPHHGEPEALGGGTGCPETRGGRHVWGRDPGWPAPGPAVSAERPAGPRAECPPRGRGAAGRSLRSVGARGLRLGRPQPCPPCGPSPSSPLQPVSAGSLPCTPVGKARTQTGCRCTHSPDRPKAPRSTAAESSGLLLLPPACWRASPWFLSKPLIILKILKETRLSPASHGSHLNPL